MTGRALEGFRVLVDMHATQSTFFGERGVRRLALDYTSALATLDTPPDVFALNPLLPAPGDLGDGVLTSGRVRWNTPGLLRSLQAEAPLVYHHLSVMDATAPSEATIPPVATAPGTRFVVTVHDVIPYVSPETEQTTEQSKLFHAGRRHLLERADLLLVNSASTRDDLLRLFDVEADRIAFAGGGVRAQIHPDGSSTAVSVDGVRPGFALTLAGWHGRKNVPGLLDAWARLSPDLRRAHQLVVVCDVPPAGLAQWEAHARRAGLAEDDVLFAGRVDDDDLLDLYRATDLFVFASLYEGFGLPVAEAICAGAAVVTSNTSSTPEILGLPEATFDPADPDDMARVIGKALSDEAFRERLLEQGRLRTPELRWGRSAERTLDAYARLTDLPPQVPAEATGAGPSGVRPASPGGRASVALVGPFAPAMSGIAAFNSRLARAMATEGQPVDRFLDTVSLREVIAEEERAGGPGRESAFPVTALGRITNPLAYDHRVYTLGNSPFHFSTIRAAEKWPGTVWLHDITLIHLYVGLFARELGEHDGAVGLGTLIERVYGDRWRAGLEGQPTLPAFQESGLRMAAAAVADAEQVFVSSRFAAELLALDIGPTRALPPIHVLPLPFPELPHVEVAPRPLEPPVVVSLGHLNESKAPNTVIDAVAAIAKHQPLQLVFVGPYHEKTRLAVLERAERQGIAGLVRVTGEVDDSTYVEWMHRAVAAIQLRTQSMGEASAAVCDAISLGLPVITNVAACRDMPSDVLRLLPPELDLELVTTALGEVVGDEREQERLRTASLAHAAGWRFTDLARTVSGLLPPLT